MPSSRLHLVLPLGVAVTLLAAVPPGTAAPARVAAPAVEAEAEPYAEVELQARTNLLVNDEGHNLPPGSSFNSVTPDLDDRGRVAFKVQVVPGGGPGIWLGRDGEGGLVHQVDPTEAISGDPTLNEDGDVAFAVGPDGSFDNELWVLDGDTGRAVPRYPRPLTPSSHGSTTLTAAGTVLSRADLGGARGWVSTTSGDRGTVVAAESAVGPPTPYHYLYTPDANDVGQVAGKIGTDADSFDPVEIRRFGPGAGSVRLLANTAADPDSPWSRFDNSVALNDEGEVAVVATRAADGARVLLRAGDDGVTEVVVAGADQPVTAFEAFPPDLNDAGQVVFRGTDADGQAVFVADADGTLTRVVAAGDLLRTDLGTAQVAQHDDSTVFGGAPKINRAGDVVLTAALTPAGDSTVEWGTGVFVAYEGGPSPPLEISDPSVSVTPRSWRPWQPATRTTTLSNPGFEPVRWRASADRAWAGLRPASGTLPPGGSVTVRVVADRSGLPHGRHVARVSVSTAGSGVIDDSVTVRMTAPRIDVAALVAGRGGRFGGTTWLGDRPFDGRSGRVGTSRVERVKGPIGGTTLDSLFRSRRVGPVGYRVTGLAPGRYAVRLGLVEYGRVERGRRVFEVWANGRRLVRGVDPAALGATPRRAVWRTVNLTHRGRGPLTVSLRSVRGAPVLSAIRVTER